MRRAAGIVLGLVLVAGCLRPSPAPPEEIFPVFVVDDLGDAEPRYDIQMANFTELSGSLVVRIEILNYAEGLPMVEARLKTTAGDHFARLVPDPTKPTEPQVRAEAGRLEGDERLDVYETCYLRSHPSRTDAPGAWYIFLELLHNETGLAEGGEVSRLDLTAADVEGSVKDEAGMDGAFFVAGGANPYAAGDPNCPMANEQGRLSGDA